MKAGPLVTRQETRRLLYLLILLLKITLNGIKSQVMEVYLLPSASTHTPMMMVFIALITVYLLLEKVFQYCLTYPNDLFFRVKLPEDYARYIARKG